MSHSLSFNMKMNLHGQCWDIWVSGPHYEEVHTIDTHMANTSRSWKQFFRHNNFGEELCICLFMFFRLCVDLYFIIDLEVRHILGVVIFLFFCSRELLWGPHFYWNAIINDFNNLFMLAWGCHSFQTVARTQTSIPPRILCCINELFVGTSSLACYNGLLAQWLDMVAIPCYCGPCRE